MFKDVTRYFLWASSILFAVLYLALVPGVPHTSIAHVVVPTGAAMLLRALPVFCLAAALMYSLILQKERSLVKCAGALAFLLESAANLVYGIDTQVIAGFMLSLIAYLLLIFQFMFLVSGKLQYRWLIFYLVWAAPVFIVLAVISSMSKSYIAPMLFFYIGAILLCFWASKSEKRNKAFYIRVAGTALLMGYNTLYPLHLWVASYPIDEFLYMIVYYSAQILLAFSVSGLTGTPMIRMKGGNASLLDPHAAASSV
eukprot:GILJ01011388.1.p1 GENE.GILJ01011388.1~~GILJ01011388.1.p1  ORF type:complete len:255 (-),score=13.54 GILJ01011388.1:104-868(-)